jgi:hypothetical protein
MSILDSFSQEISTRQRLLIAAALVIVVVLVLARFGLERQPPTGEVVPWADYPADLRGRIDALAAVGDCGALRDELNAANATNQATLLRSGHDNSRLIAYIGDQMRFIRCQ